MDDPREMTEEEVRQEFLEYIAVMVNYWDHTAPARTQRERLSGLVHSLLVMLDGGTDLPKFIVVPDPHPDDREFHRGEGDNWWPENLETGVRCDIAGSLHEQWYRVYRG